MAGDYDTIAPFYDQIGLSDFAQQMTSRLLNFAQQNEWLGRRILDIGCGTGATASFFVSHGYGVTGIDKSRAMLDQAQENLQSQSLTATLLQQDILHLENVDAPDMVVGFDVLNELDSIRDLETVFKIIYQILLPGRLFIFDLHTIEGFSRESLQAVQMILDEPQLIAYQQITFDYDRQVYRTDYDIFSMTDDASTNVFGRNGS